MEPLAIALILSTGMSVRFYWRMRTAEKRAAHLAARHAVHLKQLESQRVIISDLVGQVAEEKSKRKAAFELYRGALDDIADLRSGVAE